MIKIVAVTKLLELFNRSNFDFPGSFLNVAATEPFRVACTTTACLHFAGTSFAASRLMVVIKVVAVTKLLELFNRNNFNFPGSFLNVAATEPFRVACTTTACLHFAGTSFAASRLKNRW